MGVSYEIGDVVEYVTFGGETRIVEVIWKGDVKDGEPGFDGVEPGTDPNAPSCVWGYNDQITRVIKVSAEEDGH